MADIDTSFDIEIGADLTKLKVGLAEAGRAIAGLSAPALETADALDRAFSGTFARFEHTLERAILTGKGTFKDFANAVIADLGRIAVETLVTKPLSNFLSDLVGGLFGFGGGRAIGGPVGPGQAFLVGERGPEFFVPGVHGEIVPSASARAAPSVVVNVHARDAQSFLRSESQIANMLARAMARGQRNQ